MAGPPSFGASFSPTLIRGVALGPWWDFRQILMSPGGGVFSVSPKAYMVMIPGLKGSPFSVNIWWFL